MKHTLPLLAALLLTPAAFAQAKSEVGNATKDAKRVWESAPVEKKALWQQQRDALSLASGTSATAVTRDRWLAAMTAG